MVIGVAVVEWASDVIRIYDQLRQALHSYLIRRDARVWDQGRLKQQLITTSSIQRPIRDIGSDHLAPKWRLNHPLRRSFMLMLATKVNVAAAIVKVSTIAFPV